MTSQEIILHNTALILYSSSKVHLSYWGFKVCLRLKLSV